MQISISTVSIIAVLCYISFNKLKKLERSIGLGTKSGDFAQQHDFFQPHELFNDVVLGNDTITKYPCIFKILLWNAVRSLLTSYPQQYAISISTIRKIAVLFTLVSRSSKNWNGQLDWVRSRETSHSKTDSFSFTNFFMMLFWETLQ